MPHLPKDHELGAPSLCLPHSCSDQMCPENTPCTTSPITERQIESTPLISRLSPFIPAAGHRGQVHPPAWPDMDLYRRWPRGALTLQPLWSHVWGTSSANSAEPERKWWGGGMDSVDLYGCGSRWGQCHASSILALSWWDLSQSYECWIRAILAVRRSALLLDLRARCSPMLSGGKGLGLAPACTLLAWAELT